MEKKKYEEPTVEIIQFDSTDVIATSICPTVDGGCPPTGGCTSNDTHCPKNG